MDLGAERVEVPDNCAVLVHRWVFLMLLALVSIITVVFLSLLQLCKAVEDLGRSSDIARNIRAHLGWEVVGEWFWVRENGGGVSERRG